MEKTIEKYIVFEMIEEKKWIISDIRYYERPDVEWILHYGSCLDPKDAMVLNNKAKAQNIAHILNEQKCEAKPDSNFQVEAI